MVASRCSMYPIPIPMDFRTPNEGSGLCHHRQRSVYIERLVFPSTLHVVNLAQCNGIYLHCSPRGDGEV